METLSLFLLLYLSLLSFLCGNIHTSHIANVRMLFVSLSVVLSVFHDLFTHFVPRRTSIFNRGWKQVFPWLTKRFGVHAQQKHAQYVNAYVSMLSAGAKLLMFSAVFLWWRTNIVYVFFRIQYFSLWEDNTKSIKSNNPNLYKLVTLFAIRCGFWHITYQPIGPLIQFRVAWGMKSILAVIEVG